MKIISGILKGRITKGYDIVGTRPTMDRVKESLFSIIQNNISDAIVLDLFAGTGNLGFEALSNGAKFCYFNDKNKKCTLLIEKNAKEFNILEKTDITTSDYLKALNYYYNKNVKFDLVFLDPPYKMDVLNEVINIIYDRKMLNKNGIIVCEIDSLYITTTHFEKIKEKKYGDKYITIYKNNL